MSIRILIAGYSFTLFAVLLGFLVIARARQASRGIWWIIGGLASALTGMLLWFGIGYLPAFVTVVVANEAMLLAFVLLHRGVASILNSPRKHVWLGVALCVAQFVLFLYFFYGVPSMQARVVVRTSAICIQVAVSAVLLFRHREGALRDPAGVAGGVFTLLAVLQASEFATNIIWPPSPNRLQPGSALAFYYVFNFMVGIGCWFATVWLALCQQRQDLHLMATTDGLTGLLNRAAFDQVLTRLLRPGNRRRRPVALLLIDIDHFKAINDAYGHQAGDEVLRRISGLLRESLRPIDTVARYGGEEFAALLNGLTFDQAEAAAERLRSQIELMAGLPDSLSITASIGIAMRRDGDTPESLFKRSDEAMYLSKNLGRNRVSAIELAYHES